MSESKTYSARTVFEGLKKTFHQYLEAQYHIWDEGLIAERRQLLERSGVTFQEPQLEATPHFASGKAYGNLAIPTSAREILMLASRRPDAGIPAEPYAHQAAALEAFSGRHEEIIVATGTGSGKTEAFLMPILGALAEESTQRPRSWEMPGIRALLLYPMNALVNDQLSRLRRLLGDSQVAAALKGNRDRRATFGMYTSRTPYPGKSSPSKDRDRIGTLLSRLYQGLSPDNRLRLEKDGKWPAKDIARFIERSFRTGPEDSELFSREEMRRACPDLLVTNYSMLEYMMLRPIERPIFEQTTELLKSDSENRLIVVLDEAHVYRGSSGAEVAFLLRRLHSRLGVSRDRVRYILTSASLGSSREIEVRVKDFAAKLTGLDRSRRSFTLITGSIEMKGGERTATSHEASALAAYDFGALHAIREEFPPAAVALTTLLAKLGGATAEVPLDEKALRYRIYDWLRAFGPAALVSNRITSRPSPLTQLAQEAFPEGDVAAQALESLLALMAFARDRDTDKAFAPIRSHLFFRGLPGLFACVNPLCDGRGPSDQSAILGRLFSTPKLRCGCGSRVYELLTHRDCGAAFIRGYLRDEHGDFLWHEPSTGLWSESAVLESHFLVEVKRRSKQEGDKVEGSKTWLHAATGRLSPREPDNAEQYLPLLRPDGLVFERGRNILSFNRECPVCVRGWQGRSKIMDLATKGEAPFAHLVRQQVALQPLTQVPTDQSPNGGRKTLLFSDGRQKAARLARDIPREIEQDVFRQVLLLAAEALKAAKLEPALSHWIYVAFLHILAETGLQLFDGDDRVALRRDVDWYRKWHLDDLREATREYGALPPPRFTALLLRQLGSRFYSVSALTLGYLRPRANAFQELRERCPHLEKDALLQIATVWLQGFADQFAFDPGAKPGVRQQAAGYQVSVAGLKASAGFSKRQQQFLAIQLGELDSIVDALGKVLCEKDSGGGLFVSPRLVMLEVPRTGVWHQCTACTSVSPVAWWGHCINCLSPGVTPADPATSSYLRARKGFWRDPVLRALKGAEEPLNLSVEEHTAQLSYRDVDEPNPTTEEFERRFRDILVRPDDTSIDVLSSTTTMELGIDIGSLVGVGLRNVPPLRQNYQQRAGRAGRRGSAISTVFTYAQNSPHDNHYFENPDRIIAGEPALPHVDTGNHKIIERHVRAQLIQAFFHQKKVETQSANIFTMLGETWEFYVGDGDFSLSAFRRWAYNSPEAAACYQSITAWLPEKFGRDPAVIAAEFLDSLDDQRPRSEDDLDQSDQYLIEFLFSHGFLPSYAFPRDLCSLQIEEVSRDGIVRTIQRPQQSLSIALSEYAPGRLVVVNKKTYRIGTVASGGSTRVVDRGERLFNGQRMYVYCKACLFTAGFSHEVSQGQRCPLCQTTELSAVPVIQPEAAYPEGSREVDEYDDDQLYTQSTGAQLPMPGGESSLAWRPLFARGSLAFARSHPLVIVNKGKDALTDDGFLVCRSCGKTALDGKALGAHQRDYLIEWRRGVPKPNNICRGVSERVYLGYSFSSDILLLRVPIEAPFRFDPLVKRSRQPFADALQSLSEAVILAVGRQLDIDLREVNAGYRFARQGDEHHADIFVYDTLSGGAGYATEAGEQFSPIFDEIEVLLNSCDCSSSCDKCLRHYGNRLHHDSLDRFLAIDLVRFIRDGRPPVMFDLERQVSELGPIAQLLELAGWTVSREGGSPMQATRNGRTIDLWCYPSLVEPMAFGFTKSADAYAFSPFELSKDLPGVYAEIA